MSDVKQSRLAGKVAVITGGSTGFGRGIAALFARHGAKIVIGDLTEVTAAISMIVRNYPQSSLCRLTGGRRCSLNAM
jgi:NAD(P)-dependent dehydrogenase (short-subunit alcohol dehydrogenase family)